MRILSFDVGSRNFALCRIETEPLRIVAWEVIDTVAEAGIPSRSNIEQKKRALLQCLCARPHLAEGLERGDHVVIEQQPFGRGQGSPTMNILAHVIGAFFLLRHPQAQPACDVRQVAARAKLAVCAEDWGAVESESAVESEGPAAPGAVEGPAAPGAVEGPAAPGAVEGPAAVGASASEGEPSAKRAKRDRRGEHRQYKKNKQQSVDVCRAILDANAALAEWRPMFAASKKKDDLADAFVQALSQV